MRRVLVPCLVALPLLIPAEPALPRTCATRVERTAAGQWSARQVEGINGAGRLVADGSDPRFVAIADYEGILVSLDAGCSWEREAQYADFVAPSYATPIDAVVAGSGRNRSLHVLIGRWLGVETEPTVLSSFDDGRSWTAVPAPIGTGPHEWTSVSLTAS